MFGLSENVYNQIIDVVSMFPDYKFKLFGSRARGDYKNNSDIDIAIYENLSIESEYKIRNEFDILDIVYKIDLVFVEDNTNEDLKKSIDEEGVDL